MPRELATILCLAFIAGLWLNDARHRPPFSKALWIPLTWLLLLGSRQFSWWLWFITGIGGEASSNLEGNATDRFFYSVLILAAIVIVTKRGVRWSAVFQSNPALTAFYAYLGLTILWAAFPVPTAKWWIKELGAVPVLLIILTEEHPVEAIKAVFTRCAYFLFSFSILAEKYMPDVGRIYSPHNGLQQTTGITWQKNTLGEVVMVFGLVIVWQLAGQLAKEERMSRIFRWQLVGTLGMGLWLLYLSDSKTALVCFMMGTAVIIAHHLRMFQAWRRLAAVCAILGFPAVLTLDRLFQISASVLRMLGRDETLTNRTLIWDAVSEHAVNKMFGAGYLDYWDQYGALTVGGVENVRVQSAHNGYLDIFLDGGILGLLFLGLLLLTLGFRYVRLFGDKVAGSELALAFFCMILPHNFAESSFARRGPLWSSFLLCALWSVRAYYLAYREEPEENAAKHEGSLSQPLEPNAWEGPSIAEKG